MIIFPQFVRLSRESLIFCFGASAQKHNWESGSVSSKTHQSGHEDVG